MLLLRLPGSFLLRFDTRTFVGLLFHEPPRSSGLVPIARFSQKISKAATPPWQLQGESELEKRKKGEKQRENYSPAHRKPMRLKRTPGSYLPRLDTRTPAGLPYHEPPRPTWYCPPAGPDGSLCAPAL